MLNYLGTNKETFKSEGNTILQDLNLTIMLIPKLIIVSNDSEKFRIIRKYHVSDGHPGITHMKNNIRLQYHWKEMTRDIAKYVRRCLQCQTNKRTTKVKELLVVTQTPLKAFYSFIYFFFIN